MFWLPWRRVTLSVRLTPEEIRQRVAILLAPIGEADWLAGNGAAYDGTSRADGFSIRPRSRGTIVMGRHSEPSFGTTVTATYRCRGDVTDIELVAKPNTVLLVCGMAWLAGVCLIGAANIWLPGPGGAFRSDSAIVAASMLVIGCAFFLLGYRSDVNRARDDLSVVLSDSAPQDDPVGDPVA
jgi:hypothetical protein